MPLHTYFSGLNRYRPLSAEEEQTLAEKMARGDDTAKERFINSNLRLVVHYARKYARNGNLEDLIQEGNIGLLKAVDKFDPSRGYRFSTYATWWIQRHIFNAIDKAKGLDGPYKRLRREILGFIDVFVQKEGITPSIKEISEGLGMPHDAVSEFFRLNRALDPLSVDAPLITRGEEGNTLSNTLGCSHFDDIEGRLYDSDMRAKVERALASLDPVEEEIIRRHYYARQRPQLISSEMKIPCEKTKQLMRRALRKIHSEMSDLSHPEG